jgi:hypothetical protein
VTDDFLDCFGKLPHEVQQQARKNYRLWKQNSGHPSLQFKRVSDQEPLYSVRIGLGWRALGLRENDAIAWFWIGSHADYDKLVS